MNFELLISTMHKNTEEVLAMLDKSNVKCNALIVVQGDVESYEELQRNNQSIRIFFSKQRGLSKSRNLALRESTADYAYIMDDDVILNDGAIESLVKLLMQDNVDVGTAYFNYEDGRKSKTITSKSFNHDYLTAAKVSSIELCIRLKAILDKNIFFDESFGLGADYPSGEEYIFITDCMKEGLATKFYPICIGVHPNVTSGDDFYSSRPKVLAKREMFRRVFGWKAPLFILAFWAKKLPTVLKEGYGGKFSKTLLLGK